MRTKKRSIDLPDLAEMISSSDIIQQQYEVPYGVSKTASIPIPTGEEKGGRKVNPADYAVQPSSHMDHLNKTRGNGSNAQVQPAVPARGRHKGRGVEPSSRVPSRARGSQYMHYIPSNLSSMTMSRPGAPPPSRAHSPPPPPPPEPVQTDSPIGDDEFDEDLVNSSIPLGLYLDRVSDINLILDTIGHVEFDSYAALQEVEVVEGTNGEPDRVLIKVSWHGEAGKNVFLVVAVGDSWDDRKPMEVDASLQQPIFPQSSPATSPPPSAPTSAPTSPPQEYPPTPLIGYSAAIALAPGTHHLRFLVDGEWRMAENLPTAVNESGEMANYLNIGTVRVPGSDAGSEIDGDGNEQAEKDEVPQRPRPTLLTRHSTLPTSSSGPGTVAATPSAGTAPATPGSPPRSRHGFNLTLALGHSASTHAHPSGGHHKKLGLGLGYSFWSASSTNDGDTVETVVEQENEKSRTASIRRKHSPTSVKKQLKVHYKPQWTDEIPLELIEAAQEEETFLAHQTQLRNQMQSKDTQIVSGFIPLPNIPPAPKLPRHLEKLILNSAANPRAPGSNSSSGDKESRRRDRERRSHTTTPVPSTSSSASTLPVTTASGTDVTNIHCGHRQQHHHRHHAPPPPIPERDTSILPSTMMHPPMTGATAAAISTVNGTRNLDDAAALIADDSSILPVPPSHVVLHHLCTSAIKNGVLAVGETIRYRQKNQVADGVAP
ncbi:galactose metabolism-related protein [Paramarasmius palmivorus]|uniref:Galactose metabolism-related protein n=1 Tax=Paramarasmius palmivorus TaxID=297713 RepID=A0AAW0CGI7_9AGAR